MSQNTYVQDRLLSLRNTAGSRRHGVTGIHRGAKRYLLHPASAFLSDPATVLLLKGTTEDGGRAVRRT